MMDNNQLNMICTYSLISRLLSLSCFSILQLLPVSMLQHWKLSWEEPSLPKYEANACTYTVMSNRMCVNTCRSYMYVPFMWADLSYYAVNSSPHFKLTCEILSYFAGTTIACHLPADFIHDEDIEIVPWNSWTLHHPNQPCLIEGCHFALLISQSSNAGAYQHLFVVPYICIPDRG